MNYLAFGKTKNSKIVLIFGALILTSSLTSCSLDGGSPEATSNQNQEEQNMAGSQREYLSVSDKPGVEPIVGKPVGEAPTTLISQDIIVGSGDDVVPTSTLTAHYQLISWTTGEVLQSSWQSQKVCQSKNDIELRLWPWELHSSSSHFSQSVDAQFLIT